MEPRQDTGNGETSSGKLRVMVLDDEPIVGKRLKPALTKFGFEVEVFEDPAKALAFKPDTVFLGVGSSLEFQLRHGREHQRNRRIDAGLAR